MLPGNAFSILGARLKGQRPDLPVVVSFVGDVGWHNPQVFADSGVDYDWHFLLDLPVYIVVKPGIDSASALRGIFDKARPYPTLLDIEKKRAASVMGPRPKDLWHWAPTGAHSKELFA